MIIPNYCKEANMEIKKCEICGRELPVSDFSKSYKNRCRECVARLTREKRNNKQSKRSIFDDYLDSIPNPDREVITITIEREKGVFVDYQRDNEPKKNWKDCNTKELISINAAADVLKAGTEVTTAFGKIVGNVREIENMLGIKILKK